MCIQSQFTCEVIDLLGSSHYIVWSTSSDKGVLSLVGGKKIKISILTLVGGKNKKKLESDFL